MRTWTLDGYSERFHPSIPTDNSVRVIELEPVLDLLEGVLMPTKYALAHGEGLTFEEQEAANLLRTHGRLDG